MTIAASTVRLFVEALEALRFDWRAVLSECDVDPEQLADPEAWIPHEHFERLFVAAQEQSGDRCIGLHAGEHIHAHAVNLFGYLLLSSATIGLGISRVARYQQVLSSVPWIEVDEGSDPLTLRVGAASGASDFRAIHAEYVAGLVLRLMDWVSESEVVPEGVSFRHEARGPFSDYARILRCDVKFGADHSEFVLGAAAIALPSLHAEESIAHVHEELAERLLASRSEVKLTNRVRCVLAERLELGEADLSSVARQLGMSARSLQRRLSDEGASFRELRDGLRSELAREHLERRHTPIAGVAHLTGFSDVSAFTRAVSRWFGDTPARVRQRAARRSGRGLSGSALRGRVAGTNRLPGSPEVPE